MGNLIHTFRSRGFAGDNGDGVQGRSYGWPIHTSPNTPRLAFNNSGQQGRYLVDGETWYMMCAVKPSSSSTDPDRIHNWHDAPASGFNWGDVSPVALDCYLPNGTGHEATGGPVELTLEYAGSCPGSGGHTHWAVPLRANEWNYLYYKVKFKTDCTGSVQIYLQNSVTSPSDGPVIDLSNVRTINNRAGWYPGVQFWQGFYNASGFNSGPDIVIDQTAMQFGSSWQAAYDDVPVFDRIEAQSPLTQITDLAATDVSTFKLPTALGISTGSTPPPPPAVTSSGRSPLVNKIGLAIAGTVIGLAAAAGIYLGVTQPTNPQNPPVSGLGRTATVANVWMATDGTLSPCTRSPTKVPEPSNHANVCGPSADTAYHAAALGDDVGVDSGTYAAQTITNDSSKLAPCTAGYVHFVGRPDGVAWWKNLSINNARCVEIDGNSPNDQRTLAQASLQAAPSGLTLKQDPQAVADYCQPSFAGCPANSVPYPNGEGLSVSNCGEYVIGSALDMTFFNVTHGRQVQLVGGSVGGHTGTSADSTLAPAYYPGASYSFQDACANYNPSFITIKRVLFHDAYGGASSGAHPDCFQSSGSTDVLIEQVAFARCETSNILVRPAYNIWPCGGAPYCTDSAGAGAFPRIWNTPAPGTGAENARWTIRNSFFGKLTESGNIILWGGGTSDGCGDLTIEYSTLASLNVPYQCVLTNGSGNQAPDGTAFTRIRYNLLLTTIDSFHCGLYTTPAWLGPSGAYDNNTYAAGQLAGCGTNPHTIASIPGAVINPGSDWPSCPSYARCPVSAGSFSYDYRLLSNSVAGVFGLGASCPATDFDGAPRPVPCSIGADEFAVAIQPPGNLALPTIGGNVQVGQALSCSAGSWSNSPSSFSYRWLADSGGSGAFVAIGGATSAAYILTASEQGDRIECEVTASNAGGSGVATSSPSSPVAAAGSGGSGLAAGLTMRVAIATSGGTEYADVYKPATAPPAGGYPLVVYFQGSVGNNCQSAAGSTVPMTPTQQTNVERCALGYALTNTTGKAAATCTSSPAAGCLGEWALTDLAATCDAANAVCVMPWDIDAQTCLNPNVGGCPVEAQVAPHPWNVQIADTIDQLEHSSSIGANINPAKVFEFGFSAGASVGSWISCGGHQGTGAGPYPDYAAMRSLFAGYGVWAGGQLGKAQSFGAAWNGTAGVFPACALETPGKPILFVLSKRDSLAPYDPLGLSGSAPCQTATIGNTCFVKFNFSAADYASLYGCTASAVQSGIPATGTPIIPASSQIGTTPTSFGSFDKHPYSCPAPFKFEWWSLGASSSNAPTHNTAEANANALVTQGFFKFWGLLP